MIENNVRRERTKLGMTQGELAKRLPDGMDAIGLGYIEHGRVLPTREQLEGMCREFHCEKTDLFDESDIDLLSSPAVSSDDNEATGFVAPGDNRGHKGKVEFRVWLRPMEKEALEHALGSLGYRSNAEWLREMVRNTVARNKRIQNRV